jgi:hypothetical protein
VITAKKLVGFDDNPELVLVGIALVLEASID